MSKRNLFDPDWLHGPSAVHEAGHVVALALAGHGINAARASLYEYVDSYVTPDDEARLTLKDTTREVAPIFFLAGLACEELYKSKGLQLFADPMGDVCRMRLEHVIAQGGLPIGPHFTEHTDYTYTAQYLLRRCPKHFATHEDWLRWLKTNRRRAPAMWDYYWYLTCTIFDGADVRAVVEQVATALLNGRKMKPEKAKALCAPIFGTLSARIKAAEKPARRLARTKPLVRVPRSKAA